MKKGKIRSNIILENNATFSYADEKYWNRYWERENRSRVDFYFDKLVNQYVDWNSVKSYMEIGGAPGSIMTYLYHKYHLSVSTIDFTDREIIEKFFQQHNVNDYEIYQEDFFKFNSRIITKKYDLVASWGFVEHFSKEMCNNSIQKQKGLVAESGYLIIELPNIRKLFWLMYFAFNRTLIKIHNLEIMDLKYLRDIVLQGNEFEILYAGYYIAINEQNEYFLRHQVQRKLCKRLIEWIEKFNIKDSVRQWFFPYIILIARKI